MTQYNTVGGHIPSTWVDWSVKFIYLKEKGKLDFLTKYFLRLDVTLACEGAAVKAHRIILCACSGKIDFF